VAKQEGREIFIKGSGIMSSTNKNLRSLGAGTYFVVKANTPYPYNEPFYKKQKKPME